MDTYEYVWKPEDNLQSHFEEHHLPLLRWALIGWEVTNQVRLAEQ